jgi:hypothetical protein
MFDTNIQNEYFTLFRAQVRQLSIDQWPGQTWTLVKPFACKSNVLQVRRVLGESAHLNLQLSEQSDLDFIIYHELNIYEVVNFMIIC